MDMLIALLQSFVVLLLASGVYIALVVRKTGDSSSKGEPKRPPVQSVPRSVT
jgi:flagellar basal body-associated protein FliL